MFVLCIKMCPFWWNFKYFVELISSVTIHILDFPHTQYTWIIILWQFIVFFCVLCVLTVELWKFIMIFIILCLWFQNVFNSNKCHFYVLEYTQNYTLVTPFWIKLVEPYIFVVVKIFIYIYLEILETRIKTNTIMVITIFDPQIKARLCLTIIIILKYSYFNIMCYDVTKFNMAVIFALQCVTDNKI